MNIDKLNSIVNKWETNRRSTTLGFSWDSDEGEDIKEYLKEKYEVDVVYYSIGPALSPNCSVRIRRKK